MHAGEARAIIQRAIRAMRVIGRVFVTVVMMVVMSVPVIVIVTVLMAMLVVVAVFVSAGDFGVSASANRAHQSISISRIRISSPAA